MTNELGARNVRKVVHQLYQLVQNQEEEERLLAERKEKMSTEIEKRNRELNELEMEKTQLEAEITSLKIRDKVYQKDHTNLRNSIAIIKFRIEKIKESIENTKKKELEELKEFERAVDEITEKFRSSPAIYDRKNLSLKLEEGREEKKLLLQRIQETREAYANFNKEKGLRERSNEEEELLNCVLPGSELYCILEMTKNLDEIVRDMRENAKNLQEKENELKEIGAAITSINSRIAAVTQKATKGETEISETERKDY